MDKTLLKGLMVLEAMSQLDGAHYTLDRIAKEVGLTRSNVHRTLQTLAHAGYVRRDPDTGAYQCTLKMFELGSRQLASLDVRKIALPHMRELARLTGETVHLSVLDGFDVVYIDKIDSTQPLLAYSTIGGRAPAYAVATGKALLAFQAPDYIEHYADHLQQLTNNTHVSVPDLKLELQAVKSEGHSINLGEGGEGNPIALALPDVVCLPLAEIDGAEPVLALLFDEVLEDRCGRVVLIARLFEVVLIQVLRALMERGKVHGGLLSGLSHPRLRNALVAIHESPAREWTLDTLASVAGMSRSVFATTFRETVGVTPGQYLQGWRVQLAQKALRRGRPLKVIAAEVGYGSEAALSRAFKAQSGRSPRQWMAAH